VKLADRFKGSHADDIQRILSRYQTNINAELQARSCEYNHLLKLTAGNPQLRARLLERIPPAEIVLPAAANAAAAAVPSKSALPTPGGPGDAPLIDITGLGLGAGPAGGAAAPVAGPAGGAARPAAPAPGSLTDILDIFGPSAAKPPAAAAPVDPLAMLTGGMRPNPQPAAAAAAPFGFPAAAPASPVVPAAAPVASGNPFDVFAAPIAANPSGFAPMTVWNKGGLLVVFELVRAPSSPTTVVITSTALNSNPTNITGFVMQVAVPKYCNLQFQPPSGDVLGKLNTSKVTQSLTVQNTLQGQKPLMMKLKIDYQLDGQPITEQVNISNFPAGL